MGWQQYSRPLWLSRPNHYMLYLSAITVQMRIGWLVFHKWCNPVPSVNLNRIFAGRRAATVLSAFLRRLNLVSRLTQDLRPGLFSVAPPGWCVAKFSVSLLARLWRSLGL
jgi:hypothetical protein